MTLKEYILTCNKKECYDFYVKLSSKPKKYNQVTRNDIYTWIISLYHADSEIILKLCSTEEINVLKKLLDENIHKRENGYIDYLIFNSLSHHFLVLANEEEYYIPSDIKNYVKMAINILDEAEYSKLDVTISAILGISKIYNTISLSNALSILREYAIFYDDIKAFKKEIASNIKLRENIAVVRHNKEEYLVSLNFFYYKDVLKLRNDLPVAKYSLEELISFGKYNLNLFDENILHFLNFLELHLTPPNIEIFLREIIFYCGFDINNESVLLKICDGIEELYLETKKVISYFPIWIYNGNNLLYFSESANINKEVKKESFFRKWLNKISGN